MSGDFSELNGRLHARIADMQLHSQNGRATVQGVTFLGELIGLFVETAPGIIAKILALRG